MIWSTRLCFPPAISKSQDRFKETAYIYKLQRNEVSAEKRQYFAAMNNLVPILYSIQFTCIQKEGCSMCEPRKTKEWNTQLNNYSGESSTNEKSLSKSSTEGTGWDTTDRQEIIGDISDGKSTTPIETKISRRRIRKQTMNWKLVLIVIFNSSSSSITL